MTDERRPVLRTALAHSARPAAIAASTALVLSMGAPGASPADASTTYRTVTARELRAAFGAELSRSPRVMANLATLNAEMRAGGITTPQRKAAFLATLLHESALDPSATEVGTSATYRGRGYIQLTGAYNYKAAGLAIGAALSKHPAAAAQPDNSAAIAVWYWTVLRPTSNAAADAFDMGRVSRNVGYWASRSEDAGRCADFKRAYAVFSGRKAPSSTKCYRH